MPGVDDGDSSDRNLISDENSLTNVASRRLVCVASAFAWGVIGRRRTLWCSFRQVFCLITLVVPVWCCFYTPSPPIPHNVFCPRLQCKVARGPFWLKGLSCTHTNFRPINGADCELWFPLFHFDLLPWNIVRNQHLAIDGRRKPI